MSSRLSLMIDRQLHGMYDYPETFSFWFEALRSSDNHTAMIGKYHQLLAGYRGRLIRELHRTKTGLVDNFSEPKVVGDG